MLIWRAIYKHSLVSYGRRCLMTGTWYSWVRTRTHRGCIWSDVSLGHCWSNEAQKSPLSPRLLINLDTKVGHKPPLAAHARLHPSVSPKCTHAYALSRNGARRLLLHLRYPPFAYSRAIDQAIAWLIQRGKLKSFSVVPSLMVQRKITTSDVMASKGNGSKWRDNLTNGALAGALAGAI